MKNLFFATCILAGASLASFAQNASSDSRKEAIIKTETLAKELNLSEEQKQAVMQVNANMAERGHGRKLSAEELLRQQKETEARFRVIFTKDQFAQYEKMNQKANTQK